MSFQGDVRGIGLAELLQGLARGQKEGVLTLTSKGGRRSVLGMEDGKAWLLPDPDEDPELWRVRARSAWADDPTFTVSAARLEPLVKAARLETLFALLDGGGVHFRFDPGDLPERVTRLQEEGHPETEVHCPPVQVEFLLLEYARIADEIELAAHLALPPMDTIPCVVDHGDLAQISPNIIGQIDGVSTIIEVSDRLGLPTRQVQLGLAPGFASGGLRQAHPIEVLRLALHELQRKGFGRAAVRLEQWCKAGSPGPIVPEDAQVLASEWLAGRLTAALRMMEMRHVRCLLRRLDASLGSTAHAVVHWTEALRIAPGDQVSRLRLAAMRLRDGGEACGLEAREMLDLARELREQGSSFRAGPALAIAAFLQPEGVPQRLELGMGLLHAGRAVEGGPWILSAAADLLAQGHADRVLGPLKELTDADTKNRDARELLIRAKRQSTKTKKLRKQIGIALAGAAMVGGAAFVKLRLDEKRDLHIESIRALVDRPDLGLARLDVEFAGDTSPEITSLRSRMEDELRSHETELRVEWFAQYEEAQLEAQKGDPLEALDLIREIPRPPKLQLTEPAWPSRVDLLMGIAARLEDEVVALGEPTLDSPRQLAVEGSVRQSAEHLRAALDEREKTDPTYGDFRDALDGVVNLVVERGHARSIAELEREQSQQLVENDRLFQLAREAVDRYEYERALRHFADIIENDSKGNLRRVLREEMREVEKRRDGVDAARSAAERGEHRRALEILDETFDERVPVILPFRVETTPPGATVKVTRHDIEGGPPTVTSRTTPFKMEGTFLDSWTLQIALEDFDPRKLEIEGPQDILLDLSRTPELVFESEGRVDAIPSPLDDGKTGDYIVCDRDGAIRRIGWDGTVRWEQQLATLSGLARRPVPLPGRDNQVMFLTETGSVWLVDMTDGHPEGPLDLEDRPVLGPVVVGNEVHAQLRSGRLARWRTSLMPRFEPPGSRALDDSLMYGFEGLFTTLRPLGQDEFEIGAAATGDQAGWNVRVEANSYVVFQDGAEGDRFKIRRGGKWRYVAWEAPSIPGEPPVLWISDELGLRAFLPPGRERTFEADAEADGGEGGDGEER